MTDGRKPAPRRSARMIDYVHDQEDPPCFETDFDQNEAVPTGDAWEMFHTYVEIGAIQMLNLGALLVSAVTLRHAFEYLNHDLIFMKLANQTKVEDWLRAECRFRLGTEVDWFEQLREIANFTKHGKLTHSTSIFSDYSLPREASKVDRTGTITRKEEPRTYRSIWEIVNLPPRSIRTTLTMSAENQKPVPIDVEETLYQMRMFFYDIMCAHCPERVKARPVEIANEAE